MQEQNERIHFPNRYHSAHTLQMCVNMILEGNNGK